jgi:hypothetical protein
MLKIYFIGDGNALNNRNFLRVQLFFSWGCKKFLQKYGSKNNTNIDKASTTIPPIFEGIDLSIA